MNDAISVMLAQYGPLRSSLDEDNALKEIIQRLVLLGLHRGMFFDKAAFHGGTALRLLHGLDRFSEGMDFCLMTHERELGFMRFADSIEAELQRYGFSARVEAKRSGPSVAIESAFVKQSTMEGLIVIERPRRGHGEQLVKVRLELDKENPPGAVFVKRLVKLPVPFLVTTLDEPSLFAGKLHALIARAYLHRVKGRDYYDFLFYATRDTPVNVTYLEAKLRASGHYSAPSPLHLDDLIAMLTEKLSEVDFDKARADVRPFLQPHKLQSLEDWSADLFIAVAETLQQA